MSTALAGRLLVLCLVGATLACGDGSDPTDPYGPGGNGGDGRTVKANPSFGADIQEIFGRRGCTASQCHGVSPGQASLNLSAGAAWGDLVNVASSQDPSWIRVVPGDASVSLLFLKVSESDPPVGVRMPQGLSPLDTIDQQNIRNWIDTGAPNN